MPKVDEEYLEARRQQIILAASRCFGRKGIDGTSMREIYREAGLSSGAVYHYFASKQDIVDAVFDMSLQSTNEVMSTVLAIEDPVTAMAKMIEVVFGILDDPALAEGNRVGVVIAGEAVRDEKLCRQYKRLYDDMFQRLGSLVATIQQRGKISPQLDPAYIGRVMFSLYEGYRLQKLIDPSTDTGRFIATFRTLMHFDDMLDSEETSAATLLEHRDKAN